MFEVLASILYFPSIFVNLIGLFFGFVAVLNFSSFSIIHAAENFVFNRYSAITRRIHLPKHRTPREFTPSVCFMGGKFYDAVGVVSPHSLTLNTIGVWLILSWHFLFCRWSAVDVRNRSGPLCV